MLTHVCHHVDFTKLIVADKSNLIQHKYQKWFGNIKFQTSTYAVVEWCSGWRGSPLPWLALWLAPNHISFQPSNIKPSWSNEYLILFRFNTSSESPYIRFLVLVIQVWFIRLQKFYLNVNFWVRLISFMWKFTEQKHLRISEIPNATQSLDLTKLHFPDAAGRITFWWKHIGDLIVLVLALLLVLLHQRDNNGLYQNW